MNVLVTARILSCMEDLSMTDASLVALARSGQVEAMGALLERYRPALYAFAIGLLRNREDALDAVQETFLTALARLASLRDPAAVGGWLRAILRNICFMRLRHAGRETLDELADVAADGPVLDELVEQLALREWIWGALHSLAPEDRVTVILRYFTRCTSYQAIAAITGVPIGTVRSRLNRSRSRLSEALRQTVAGSSFSHSRLASSRRREWEQFYAALYEALEPRTYRDSYTPDVQVGDSVGRWSGVVDWSAHEREAITLGVRARIVGLIASPDMTILEIDFTNPTWASDHCPPRSTFVHHLLDGRSRRLDIQYV